MSVGLEHYDIAEFFSQLAFALTKRNIIVILISIELMLIREYCHGSVFPYITPLALTGQVFAIFIMR
jgi:NADH:ubiquinone oxidoreductase subunit K